MEAMEEQVWFYMKNQEEQGPAGTFELVKLFEQGVLTGDSLIWNKDMNRWQKAKMIKAFDFLALSSTSGDEESAHSSDTKERPIVRFLARIFDLSVFSLVFMALVTIFSPRFILESSHILIFIMSLVLYILAEAFILSIFGNTIGKTLLHTKIKSLDGRPINFLTAFKRSLFANTAGLGLGVPIINVICSLFSFFDLKKHGTSKWDKQFGTVVLYGHVTWSRILLVSLLPLSLLIASIML